MIERAQPACHICGHHRSGSYCLNCEQWVCWKHGMHVSYWQPNRRICDRCAALPALTRKRLR